MRLINHAGTVSVGDVEHEQAYGIEFNPFMASLLSDKLYTDKPYACWRELYANAHDESSNIQVRLPDYMDQTCMIWDSGVGLDRDCLINLFCTYGASNKRDTNSKIGGFGVGSKVLFSYTDTFSAFSVRDGVRTEIVCYKNDEGMPTARILGHGPSDEQSGTCIKWAVSDRDINKFRNAALEVFARFEHKPVFVDQGPDDLVWMDDPYATSTKHWGVRKKSFSKYLSRTGSGATLVMGGIAYPIESSSVGHNEFNDIVEADIDIFAPIGAAQLAASREALSYDSKTLEYVKRRLKDMRDEATERAARELQKAPNWYQRELIREQIEAPIPFLKDNRRMVPEAHEIDTRVWHSRHRSSIPTRLKFEDRGQWTVDPKVWEDARKLTRSEWKDKPLEDKYGRRLNGAYDCVIAFNNGGKGMPPGFTNRIAAFAKHHNLNSIVLLTEKAHKWCKTNHVPTDQVLIWDSAMHEKWKPSATMASTGTYHRKKFADVRVFQVVSSYSTSLQIRDRGTMSEFAADSSERFFALSSNRSYISSENPGLRNREAEVGWLCAAEHLEVLLIPKSYKRILGKPFYDINKEPDKFHAKVDLLLKDEDKTLIEGYVRSKLYHKIKATHSRDYSVVSGHRALSEQSAYQPPKWLDRYIDILSIEYREQRAAEYLSSLVDKNKADLLVQKELDKFNEKLYKKPLLLPILNGISGASVTAEAALAVTKYLRSS